MKDRKNSVMWRAKRRLLEAGGVAYAKPWTGEELDVSEELLLFLWLFFLFIFFYISQGHSTIALELKLPFYPLSKLPYPLFPHSHKLLHGHDTQMFFFSSDIWMKIPDQVIVSFFLFLMFHVSWHFVGSSFRIFFLSVPFIF